ncbi:tetracycline efflux protein [Arthroderma uncinatum]|uniref:tetracycline efflux protein n=1 Tax=Arthroderma uncinatum TaxID=74035 RepID=UPI00144A7B6E|nr:tetracycline efflux protein [Arthroderma uncinatum]KAF3482152.1 tetracycline efflux protein [Arthroderma uncinatum]
MPNLSSEDGQSSEESKEHMFNEQTNYVSTRKIITIFLACASVDLVALMDQTTLASSLSIIGNDLNAGNQTSWIAGGFFLTSTCFQLLYGRLSDIWSRKVMLFVGLAIFFFGSLASSFAQTALQLIIFRAFTGIGGGGLANVAQMIVSDVVPLRDRGKYQGILGSVVALANGVGPVIGGALSSISKDSWRWIFRLNLPLTILTTLCVLFFMPLRKVEGNWKVKVKAIDFFGAFLALAGATVFLLGLIWGGGEYAWNSVHVISTLVIGFAVSVSFVLWQWKGASYPLVPMVNGWNFVVQIYYIPTFYQLVYGYSATRSGALLLPIVLMQTLCSTLSGLIVHWVGRYRECILFGWLTWAIGLGLFSTLDESSGLAKQIGYGILTGVGVGNTLQPSLIAIQAGVQRRDMAVITSFRNFVRNLGGTLGLAVSGTILNNIVVSSLSSLNLDDADHKALVQSPSNYLATHNPEEAKRIRAVLLPAYQKGFRIIFILCSSLAVAAFVLAFFLMPHITLKRPDDKALKEEAKSREDATRLVQYRAPS